MTRLDRTVTALLARAAARDLGHPLVEDEHLSLTGSELATRVVHAAAELATAGVGGGDRVALWLVNSIGFVEAFLGVLACGAHAQVLAPIAPAGARFRRIDDVGECRSRGVDRVQCAAREGDLAGDSRRARDRPLGVTAEDQA